MNKLIPKYLIDSNDDWQEQLRRNYYPKLHKYLKPFGGYATGHVGEKQYIGKFNEDEDAIEAELDDRGRRNPIACLKSLSDGRVSEGSWVILHEDCPDLVEEGMQIHMTLFVRADGKSGREIYAHYEDDWRSAPIAHLRESNFQVEKGAKLGTEYVNEYTNLVLQ